MRSRDPLSFFAVAVMALVCPLLLLLVWHFCAEAVNSSILIPKPGAVFHRLLHPFHDLMGMGSLARHTGYSLLRVLIGFLVGAVLGVALGVAAGVNRYVGAMLEPFVELLRSICPVAWIPFALVLFKLSTVASIFGAGGTGGALGEVLLAMVFVIGYGSLFPVFVNTLHGVRSVRNLHLEAAAVLGSSGFHRFWHVLLPAALPSIFTGLRLGMGTSWFVIVAAEMLPGPSSGLGYLIIYAYQMAEMEILVAGMIVIGMTGGLLHWLMRRLTFPLTRWQINER